METSVDEHGAVEHHGRLPKPGKRQKGMEQNFN
jgi:hypothetical protein